MSTRKMIELRFYIIENLCFTIRNYKYQGVQGPIFAILLLSDFLLVSGRFYKLKEVLKGAESSGQKWIGDLPIW